MQTFDLSLDPETVGRIVDDEFPAAPPEVRAAIVEYAQGNWGCACLLALACKDRCTTAYNVTEVVGWPLPPPLAPEEASPTSLLPSHRQAEEDEEDIPTLPVRVVVERQESGWQLYLRLKSGYDAYEQVVYSYHPQAQEGEGENGESASERVE